MCKIRAKVLPPNPTNINEVHHQYIDATEIITEIGEYFYYTTTRVKM